MSPFEESDAHEPATQPDEPSLGAAQVEADQPIDASRRSTEPPDTGEIVDESLFDLLSLTEYEGDPECSSRTEPPPVVEPSSIVASADATTEKQVLGAELLGLVTAVDRLEDSVSRRLDLLQKSFDRELRAEANRERVVERLHAELQDYKQDLLLKVQRPIFIDLIQLHDDIGKMIEAPPADSSQPDSGVPFAFTLESIRTAIEDILYRQGVEPFSSEADAFDPRQQRAISTQSTTDPALNKQICARVRKGFRAGEKLIRPEIVSVFTYRSSV